LLDKNYLSLAEVQVVGVDLSYYLDQPATKHLVHLAFAALKADGSITAWGRSHSGGKNAPTDKGYIKVYSTDNAFAALKADGSITAWGESNNGGSGAPTDSGYTKVYSTASAFAAVKADGSITAWGDSYSHCQWVRLYLHYLNYPTS
jgi:hypothetical protein